MRGSSIDTQQIALPRPGVLALSAAIHLTESFGLPLAVFAGVNALAGERPGLLAGLGCAWATVAARRIFSGQIPGLLIISTLLLSVQTVVAFTTGEAWIYLLQPAIAKLLLSGLFVRSARTTEPLVGQLAREVCALPETLTGHVDLRTFFRKITLLWAGIFGVLGTAMVAMSVTQSVADFLLTSTVATVGLVLAGALGSFIAFRRCTRGLGLRLHFARG